MPDAISRPLISVIEEALGYEAEAFGEDHPVEGADLVEWFAQWRLRAQAAVAAAIGNKTSLWNAVPYGERISPCGPLFIQPKVTPHPPT